MGKRKVCDSVSHAFINDLVLIFEYLVHSFWVWVIWLVMVLFLFLTHVSIL